MQKKVASPSTKAEQIIRRLLIRDPSEILIREIAMERGALVKERVLDGCEARLIRRGNLGIITVNSSIPEEGRKRFALAHELGHFELHRASQLILCTEKDMFLWNESKSREIEANDFAASLLMPEMLFSRYLKTEPPNIDTIKEIAKIFRTTLTATSLRFVQLSVEPCAAVISKDCNVKWYKKSGSFDFHVKVGEKLSQDTLAFDFFDGVALPHRPQRVPAYGWLAGNIDEEAEIFEHSLAFPNYNMVLTLLWIYSEIRSTRHDGDDPKFDLTNPFTPDGKRWLW